MNAKFKVPLIALMYLFVGGIIGFVWGMRHGDPWYQNQPLLDAFKNYSYNWSNNDADQPHWLGVPIQKGGIDTWTYQEIIFDTKPDVLVEAGTYKGGSALYFASIFDLVGHGRVLSIDIKDYHPPQHPRIIYLIGSSVSDEIFTKIKSLIKPGERVMVSLDSAHTKDHVLKELRLYAPLVTVGCYLVVEDTDLNGHPIRDSNGPGPFEAVEEFLGTNKDFIQDRSREQRGLTGFPGGWLKRLR